VLRVFSSLRLSRARWFSSRTPLPVLALMSVTIGVVGGRYSARGAATDPSLFTGTWACDSAAKLTTTCNGTSASETLQGRTLSIGPGTDTDLVLDINCHCHLPLNISASDPGLATLVAPTACAFVYNEFDITATVETLTLRTRMREVELNLVASKTHSSLIGDCESSSISAVLSRTSSIGADCGADANAVGVLPFSIEGSMNCPFGAGREGLRITIADESDARCFGTTGARDEGWWALPQASKYDSACRASKATDPQPATTLALCRVDGRSFKPLTTDPAAVEQFYAVLKLGDDGQPCPNGSIEMIRRVDSEDDNNISSTLGHLGPNQVGNQPPNTSAILHFCFFRWADNEADTMTDFPDLGFSYAIFHDFDDHQPLWVTLKRTLFSNNESRTNQNMLNSVSDDAEIVEQFKAIVETPDNATSFDLARVR
jgi:hypothetical protein